MKAHTFDSSAVRPAWLPWLLVAGAWVAAAAGGLFDGPAAGSEADAGVAPGVAGDSLPPLTSAAALTWYEAHPAPRQPDVVSEAPIEPAETASEGIELGINDAPADADLPEGAGAEGEGVPRPPGTPPASRDTAEPVPASPRDATAARPDAAAQRRMDKAPPAEPKTKQREREREREPEPTSLAAPTTALPTITIQPPGKEAAPKTKETAQEATARATAHLNAKRWVEAEEAFGVALALPGGRSAAVLYGRARTREAQGDDVGAERDLNDALAVDPRHPYALLLLGDLAKGKSDLAAARDAYRRYVEAWPNGRRTGELTVWLNRGSE